MFTSENAAHWGKVGGSATGDSFKQKARDWIKQNGYEKLLEWIGSDSERKATFALGLLFSYALGKPAEKIQIDDRKELYLHLAKDPDLNALAQRFGAIATRVREVGNGSVVDGELAVQVEGASTSSL